MPFEPKVALRARLSMGRNDGDKERAVVDLLADLPVPSISAPQFALVEPDLDVGGPQRIANALSRRGVLRRVA